MELPLLDGRSQRGAGSEQVFLTDEVPELGRAHARSQRLLGERDRPGAPLRLAGVEQSLHLEAVSRSACDGDD